MLNSGRSLGILLVGHGTRDEVGTQQFLELAEGLKEAFAPLAVEAAFLELAQPGISVAVDRLLDRGVDEIVTAPVILFAAGHVKRDIPLQVASAITVRGRSDIRQVQVGHLGCHEALVELSRVRMEEAVRERSDMETRGQGDNGTECLLLVARGSTDEAAAEEMRQFAALRQAGLSGVQVEVAFLAKARPSFEDKLAEIKALLDKPEVATEGTESRIATGCQTVIVQPHLLFEGELVDRIRSQIAEIAAEQPQTEWIVTQPLADSPGKTGLARQLLRKVILDRCNKADIHVVASAGDD